MQVIRTHPNTDDLGKTKPATLARTVTAEEHSRRFYAFDTTDVWTADGWLVTAVQSDGTTHHLRRGRDVIVATLEPTAELHYNPTPKTVYMLGE